MRKAARIPTRAVRQSACHRSGGFSLIELMIAMVIGLILTGGMILMFTSANSNFQQLTNTSRQLENGRYALQALRDDIRMAGFYGEFTQLLTPNALPLACNMAELDNAWRRLPVQGAAAGGAAGVSGCLPDFLADTNVLVVRRASTVATPFVNLQDGVTYLQTRRENGILQTLNVGDDPTAIFTLTNRDGTTPADVRRMMVNIYFVRGCSVCGAGGDNIPTLWRSELTGAGFVSTPIAAGIENMQLQYGIDSDGDGSPNDYQAAPFADVADWGDVVSVSVRLLARNTEAAAGHTDNRTYDLGNLSVGPFNDAFKRQVFTTVARVENLSSRRESQ